MYHSLAASYENLPVQPDLLFGENGVLAGGQTISDVEKDLKRIVVPRPKHLPEPQIAQHENESPQLIAALSVPFDEYSVGQLQILPRH